MNNLDKKALLRKLDEQLCETIKTAQECLYYADRITVGLHADNEYQKLIKMAYENIKDAIS